MDIPIQPKPNSGRSLTKEEAEALGINTANEFKPVVPTGHEPDKPYTGDELQIAKVAERIKALRSMAPVPLNTHELRHIRALLRQQPYNDVASLIERLDEIIAGG